MRRFHSTAKQFMQPIMGLREPNGISGLQCRMARAGLRWSLTEAAEKANIGRASIVRIEADARTNPATVSALRRAFEAAGVNFIDEIGLTIGEPKKARKARKPAGA